MFFPGKRVCELCQEREIGKDDEMFPIVFYPLEPAEIERLALEFAASVNIPEGGVLGQIMPVVMPRGVRLEFCKPCADGFIPMLEQLKGLAIDRISERMKARAERNKKGKVTRPVFGPDDDDA